jgi:hypothetical protein
MTRKKTRSKNRLFAKLREQNFEVLMLHHAEAILSHDMPEAAGEIEEILLRLTISSEELVRGGGGEGDMTQRLRRDLAESHGWRKHNFTVTKHVDGVQKESISHEIDHVKTFSTGTFALEIEWNNKDPFFDRDLENFKRLHADGVISIGGIITRGTSLQDSLRTIIEQYAETHNIHSTEALADYYTPTPRQRGLIASAINRDGSFAKGWSRVFVSDKFGEATTHWRKLQDRVQRGVGNPCPLLLIGIPASAVVP